MLWIAARYGNLGVFYSYKVNKMNSLMVEDILKHSTDLTTSTKSFRGKDNRRRTQLQWSASRPDLVQALRYASALLAGNETSTMHAVEKRYPQRFLAYAQPTNAVLRRCEGLDAKD